MRRASELCDFIEGGVRTGVLKPGTQLGTVRELAGELGLNPNTVAVAYRTLRDRGIVTTSGRRGTRIADAPAVRPAYTDFADVPAGAVDLASGNPDPALLPDLSGFVGQLTPGRKLYDDDYVNRPLHDRINAGFLADGVPGDHVSIVHGALDGIERLLLARLRPGDRVGLEDPCFTGLVNVVRTLGLVPVGIGVDAFGILPADLRHALPGLDALLVTSRVGNPTGSAFDAARAFEIADVVSQRAEVFLVQNDHGALIADTQFHAIHGEATDNWAVVRSVSKSLGPDIRVGFVKGDEMTMARLDGRQLISNNWVSGISQALVEAVLASPETQTQMLAAQTAYHQRRSYLIDALESRHIPYIGGTGLNVWIPVPDETRAAKRLLENDIAVRLGHPYRLHSAQGIRITVSNVDSPIAGHMADLLAKVV